MFAGGRSASSNMMFEQSLGFVTPYGQPVPVGYGTRREVSIITKFLWKEKNTSLGGGLLWFCGKPPFVPPSNVAVGPKKPAAAPPAGNVTTTVVWAASAVISGRSSPESLLSPIPYPATRSLVSWAVQAKLTVVVEVVAVAEQAVTVSHCICV